MHACSFKHVNSLQGYEKRSLDSSDLELEAVNRQVYEKVNSRSWAEQGSYNGSACSFKHVNRHQGYKKRALDSPDLELKALSQ